MVRRPCRRELEKGNESSSIQEERKPKDWDREFQKKMSRDAPRHHGSPSPLRNGQE